MSFQTKASIASFGGTLLKLSHPSKLLSCDMAVNLYLPPSSTLNALAKAPVLFFLSGLSCTPDNCTEKGFFQHAAGKRGIAMVWPDTSPRGLGIAGEDDGYDFGTGAGFYVDATKEPWARGYQMYSYIADELPRLLFGAYPQLDGSRVGLTGHSMGGHGALTLFLKNPGKYKSVSALAPITNPSRCPWGEKAFQGYFGDEDRERWKAHDATELVKRYQGPLDLLIDVGTADNFYRQGQLLPENFAQAAKEGGNDRDVKIRFQEGHDHSYFTVATFAEEHVDHAAKGLFA